MPSRSRTLLAALSIASAMAGARSATAQSLAAPMSREEVVAIDKKMREPLKPGEIGPKEISDGLTERPDPTKPMPVTLPNGQHAFVVGISGPAAYLVFKMTDLHDQEKIPIDVELYNDHGFRYGGEIDPATGQPLGYASDSTVWDFALAYARNLDGSGTHLVGFAGAMANGRDGRPLLYKEGQSTRQRVIFHDLKFVWDEQKARWKIVGRSPTAPFNQIAPVPGEWVIKDEHGNILFGHGYGGEPVTLLNGELYLDERGWVPFHHETVIEQRELPNGDGKMRKVPYLTVVSVTYMDPTLTRVMQSAITVLTPFKEDGTVWEDAERPGLGPLVEGGHVEVQFNGKPVESMDEVTQIRNMAGTLEFPMLFSAGEYYAKYGSFMATAMGRPEGYKALQNSHGQLYNLTAAFSAAFIGFGRPVVYRDENRQANLLGHGAIRSSFPEGMEIEGPSKSRDLYKFLKRGVVNIPVSEHRIGHVTIFHPIDNTGVYPQLRDHTINNSHLAHPQKVKVRMKVQVTSKRDARPSKRLKGTLNCRDLLGRSG